MKHIDKAIEMLQAMKQGETVQWFMDGDWVDLTGDNAINVIFNVASQDINYLRIKPCVSYRPYSSADEFIKDAIKHNNWIKVSDEGAIVPYSVLNNEVYFSRATLYETIGSNYQRLTFKDLMKYNWADDNTPCAVKK